MNDNQSQASDWTSRLEEAADWHDRLTTADADKEAWSGFTLWLEAHPDNRRAYDQVENVDADLADPALREGERNPADVLSLAQFERQPARAPRPLPWLAAGAVIAASLLIVIFTREIPTTEVKFETRVGETKTITLSDRTQIDLNTKTTITVATLPDARHVVLDHGEALFRVVHDKDHPFSVAVGDQNVRDIGTVFDVMRDNRTTTVTVAEGLVSVGLSGAWKQEHSVVLSRGEQLVRADGSQRLTVVRVDPDSALTWRQGYLVYREAPLSKVVADLNRYFQAPITLADGEVGDQRFSGALKVDSEDAVLRRLSQFLPITVERDQGGKITLRMSRPHR